VVDRSHRSGVLLLEVVFSLLLLSLLVSAGWTILARHVEVGNRVSHQASVLETIRTLAWLMGQETGVGLPGVDWNAAGDSLPLRAFRGFALPERGSWVGQRVRVCFKGYRSPAPEKDSVLLLDANGAWTALDLTARAHLSSGCNGMAEWEEEEWVFSEARPGAIFGRLYESGSYHLSDEALRYRRGRGGRQPVTPETLVVGSFLDPPHGSGGVRWEVLLKPASGEKASGSEPGSRSWRGGG
jgi:hypothetical protein